jgi:hypothetical protein
MTTLRRTPPFWFVIFSQNTRQRSSPQPQYSPELAPADFFLFTRLKFILKGQRFGHVEKITENSPTGLLSVPKYAFQECLQNWKKRWERCIKSGGEYFEGYKVQQLQSTWKNDLFILFGIFADRPRKPAACRIPLQFVSSPQSPYTQCQSGWRKFPPAPRQASITHNKSVVRCTSKLCRRKWHYAEHTAPSRVFSRPLTAHRTPPSTPCGSTSWIYTEYILV